jgi:hypothetical protein
MHYCCWQASAYAEASVLWQGEGAYGRVYKGLRGGVQDVALKQLSHSGDGQLEKFIEVRLEASCPVVVVHYLHHPHVFRLSVSTDL